MGDIVVNGHQIDLSDGRHVFVAEHEGAFLIEFKNKDGKITRLALSRDAGEALRYLLGDEHAQPADVIKKYLRFITIASEATKERMEWQLVPRDEAPELTKG